MVYRFTCGNCGRQIEGETQDGVVQQAQRHLKNAHDMQRPQDVTEPNLAYEEDEIRDRIEEIDE